jgi:predicted acylesterase/phospholipase RssA
MKIRSRLLPLVLVAAAGLFTLQGCAPAGLMAAPSPADVVAAFPGDIRIMGPDHRFTDESIDRVARAFERRRAPLSLLALSGGGADAAFGAGALVGLTRARVRPQFSVVTGVSAGALLAPYAFLGHEWDSQLTDAYTSGRAEHLLQPRGLGAIFDSSVYRGRPLEQLVDHYLSDDMLQAIAGEAASGRLLLVATTNVDSGETVIWDLGSIALNGGDGAKALFRDILVASASVPGLFPPVVMRIRDDGGEYDEAHVDGTATVPFLVPTAFVQPSRDAPGPPPSVYVMVDGRMRERAAATRLRFRTIVSRSIAAGMNHMMRTHLELTAATAQQQGAILRYSAIPSAYPNLDPFDFRTSAMRALFQYGYECAQGGRLWIASQPLSADPEGHPGNAAGPNIPCPADDEFIRRIAAR